MKTDDILLWILFFFMALIIPCGVIIKIHYCDNDGDD